ncbi:DNA-binding response regulator [Nostoc sp. MG11]|uniref:response regulator transcription factor n=1 Tax=Nostoc sp. MG11 TaxID=2721166 RepID=UPI0018682839|nr:DNA-binding response regulator [Nostoc sp. MG11]
MKKILVIDSELETKNFFVECLETAGYCVLKADNGLISIQQAQAELPDLIISEISLTEIDGYSILSSLRQNPSTAMIPLIFVTNKIARSEVRRAMELGADDYITKPCTVNELLNAISACLTKRAFLQRYYTTYSASQFLPLAQPLLADSTPPKSQPKFPPDSLLSKVFSFIEHNYEQQITLADVAIALGYSSTYLTNLVRRQTGRTVQNWIIEYRMRAACNLLLNTDEKIEAIAAKVGYQNVTHFFRQFRQHQGTTPHTWKAQQRRQQTKNDNKTTTAFCKA